MKWYFAVLNKYAVFNGRASRTEYWMFVLFHYIILIALSFFEIITGIFPETELPVLNGLYGLAVLIPIIAVVVRRLHDTGRSGWWCLIVLIPIIGGIVFLVWTVQDSHPGENKYGPNPKGQEI